MTKKIKNEKKTKTEFNDKAPVQKKTPAQKPTIYSGCSTMSRTKRKPRNPEAW